MFDRFKNTTIFLWYIIINTLSNKANPTMPVTKKNKLYIVHQPPKSGEQGTILLKGADLRIEDGILD